MAGVDEQFQDGAIQFYDLVNGNRGPTLIQNKREGANTFGGFAQGELRWGDDWLVRLAARYDNIWYISEDRINPAFNASKRFTQVTPKGAIARMFERHTLYASVGGGVEAPAFNEIDPPPPFDTLTSFNPFLDPMTSVSYELGAKGMLAGDQARFGALAYDLAFYLIDVKNDIVPWNGGAYLLTAGKSRRIGAEVGFDWRPVNPLTVASAVTVSNNEYLEYENDLSAGEPDGNFDGNQVAGLPSVFLDTELRWRPAAGLTLAGTVRYVDDYFADDANTASAEAYGIFGARAEYVRPMGFGSVRVFLAGENLTDEDYVASVFINGIGGQFYEPGLPRNVSLGISLGLR
jgi:iron complex outermembrane receptor protein